jgi:hypothetical protein
LRPHGSSPQNIPAKAGYSCVTGEGINAGFFALLRMTEVRKFLDSNDVSRKYLSYN